MIYYVEHSTHQVSPTELELLLQTHPAVAGAVVIGVPNDVDGQMPRAFVQLAAGHTVKEAVLVKFVQGLCHVLSRGICIIDMESLSML